MNDKYADFKYLVEHTFPKIEIRTDEILSRYTTFKIGGPAKLFISVDNVEELTAIVKLALIHKIPYFIIGGGTNICISDNGYQGLIIKNNLRKYHIKKYQGRFIKNNFKNGLVEIEAESGVPVHLLVRFTIDKELSGLEAFYGQPGTVGGAVYINAHNMKFLEFFGEKVSSAQIINTSGNLQLVTKSFFKFGYDSSILQKDKITLVTVSLLLEKGNKQAIWKKADLAMKYRQVSQPLGIGSAGCTFRNISKADSLRIGLPNGITSAGYLLEAVGLKGLKKGGAQISDRHANFILNTGGAKNDDVKYLIRLAKDKVWKRFKVRLNEEIIFLEN